MYKMYKNTVQKSYVVKSLLIEQENNKISVRKFFSEPTNVLYTLMWTASLKHIIYLNFKFNVMKIHPTQGEKKNQNNYFFFKLKIMTHTIGN